MANTVLNFEDITSENIVFSEPKKNKFGGKAIYVNLKKGNEKLKLRIKTPELRAPFGISGWDGKQSVPPTETTNDTFNLTIDEAQVEVLKKIDELAIKHCLNYAEELFGESEDGYELRDLKKNFSSCVKKPKDPKYQSRLQMKLFKNQGSYSGIVYRDIQGNKYNLTVENHSELLPKGSMCRCVLECGGIWIINGKFGVSWRIIQVKVRPNNDSLEEDVFSDTEEQTNVDSEEETSKNETEEVNTDEIDDFLEQSISEETQKKRTTRRKRS
ncbi:MAG TPA: hypothetical protein V6C58_14125 [Allocoleopsis sp.]